MITQLRKEKGITQAEFARRLGTSQSAVNRIEHGKQNLSMKILQRISDTLDYQLISLNYLGKPIVEVEQSEQTGKLIVSISGIDPKV